ncbi:MAG: hypothetical protein ACHQ9S_20040 [Candidatus Binatia bacterium]
MRPQTRSRLIRAALAAFVLALVATAFPRGAVAQGTEPSAKAPLLWTDPQTGQVFTKSGPGRVPLTPSGALSNEQPNSQIQALQQETNKNGIQLGGVNLRLGGFIESAGIYRTRNEVADVGSDYNGGIPFNQDPKAHENETRFSARQSRLSILATGDVSHDTHLAAYYEMDFLAAGTTSNSRESNSYTPRSRHIYATLDKDDWGLHVLAGQAWSLLTTNSKGIIPRQEQIPLTIDAQYVEGFNWLRVPQFRIVEDFGGGLWAGVSAESPQAVTSGGVAVPTGVNDNNSGNPAGLLNNATTYTNDYIPDLDGKIAFEPGWGHYELKGLVREFTARAAGTNRTTTGYGVGGAATMPIMPSFVELQLSGLYGYGIGRYGSGQLTDIAFKSDNRYLVAIPEAQGLVGLIGHPWAGNDLYLYGGWEHADRAGASSTSGYGWSGLDVSGCDVEGGKTCQAETRDLKQITAGFWQDVYKGSYGRFVFGLQGGQIWRDAFSGTGGKTPRTNIGIFMTSVRYYPFS